MGYLPQILIILLGWLSFYFPFILLANEVKETIKAEVIRLPEGTKIGASFATEANKGADKLFDGDPNSFMVGAGGSCRNPFDVLRITLRFPHPIENLAGVETGESCRYHNYYPIEWEFWVDSDNDGRFDTFMGRTRNLGPAKQSIARHFFIGRVPQAWGLEIRSIEQHVGGGHRAWTMNEIQLLVSDQLPLIQPTPYSYRCMEYEEPIPKGTAITTNFPCEEGKGPERLLDGDPTTFMVPQPNTAKEGKSVSLFLRFPLALSNVRGLKIGRGDPLGNYVWETLELWGDCQGDGVYSVLLGSFQGGSPGIKRFKQTASLLYGIELRVTQQKLQGVRRAFMLNEIETLVFEDDPGEGLMEYVLEDFEDLSSWRVWANNTAQPTGERPYGGYTYICGIRSEEAREGQAVGVIRYCFKEPRNQQWNRLWAKRGKIAEVPLIIDKITMEANPQNYPCRIAFELVDSRGKKATTPFVDIRGNEWKRYEWDLTPAKWPLGTELTLPLYLQLLILESPHAGEGNVLVDRLAILGTVNRHLRVTIKPIWEGIAYNPEQPLNVRYRIRNALPSLLETQLRASLYSSFDALRNQPIVKKDIPISLPPFGEKEITVPFGKVPYGHYEAELEIKEPKIMMKYTDCIAVMKPNGGRINTKPMWFGSMHPAGWISDLENRFILEQIVIPLGLDCYRTGSPAERYAQWYIQAGLLLAAGAGGTLPSFLHKPGVKKPEINEPNDYQAYQQWWETRAAKEYAPYQDRIISVEFYNEPDLPDFEFVPEIDVYLKMWETWAAAMRKVVPRIRLGTGGATVFHAKAKKDFNERMYTELAQKADVAIWHAHGLFTNYTTRHRTIENWLRKGGRSDETMWLGNSEAGMVSYHTPQERLLQAVTLVQKIGWAKAQRNSLFYIWFTTTDTFDPQGGYLAGENWGLVTYNQRLKPSGQAMNEIIRQLANTEGLGEINLDPRIFTCHYRDQDGGTIWLIWPHEIGTQLFLKFATNGLIEQIDMFGKKNQLYPQNGVISFFINGYPTYLRAKPGIQIQPAHLPTWIQLPEWTIIQPNQDLVISLKFKNIWGQDLTFRIQPHDGNVSLQEPISISLTKDEKKDVLILSKPPKNLKPGLQNIVLKIECPQVNIREEFSVNLVAGVIIPVTPNGLQEIFKQQKTSSFSRPPYQITLKGFTSIQDLVDDPHTPKWSGPDDLSVVASFLHDQQGLYCQFEVTDQFHFPGEPGEKLWMGDSVQLAFAIEGKHTEIGLTEKDGGIVWRWIAADGRPVGKISIPYSVIRKDNLTLYQCYIPFEELGFRYRPHTLLRMAFLINENDGQGRVRLLKWFDGIHPSKNTNLLGYMVLE